MRKNEATDFPSLCSLPIKALSEQTVNIQVSPKYTVRGLTQDRLREDNNGLKGGEFPSCNSRKLLKRANGCEGPTRHSVVSFHVRCVTVLDSRLILFTDIRHKIRRGEVRKISS